MRPLWLRASLFCWETCIYILGLHPQLTEHVEYFEIYLGERLVIASYPQLPHGLFQHPTTNPLTSLHHVLMSRYIPLSLYLHYGQLEVYSVETWWLPL